VGAAAEDADRAVAAVGDGDLVGRLVDAEAHRPVESRPGSLDPADRRRVAVGVAGVDGDRRLVEAAADEGAALAAAAASAAAPAGGPPGGEAAPASSDAVR